MNAGCKATAFMNKQQKWIANVRFIVEYMKKFICSIFFREVMRAFQILCKR